MNAYYTNIIYYRSGFYSNLSITCNRCAPKKETRKHYCVQQYVTCHSCRILDVARGKISVWQ